MKPLSIALVAGARPEAILDAARKILGGHGKKGSVPPLWDGNAAERISEILVKHSVKS